MTKEMVHAALKIKRSSIFKWIIVFATFFCLTACKSLEDGMLNPKGFIATEERRLLFDTLALMLIVVLPVIIMSITFVIHYRESHHTRDYKPNWSHSYFLESLWWGIPCVIIVILAILTWIRTHELDPYNKIKGHDEKPLLIQAIALPWKWLFIYPDENIATVNYLEVPVGQQIEFWTTTDNVPMSALFIPQLGSQIYTMSGMRTRMYLDANEPGNYTGMNTLFNGNGFAEMRFEVHAVTPDEMQQWIMQTKKSTTKLTEETYTKLLQSSINDKPEFYSGIPKDLFQNVMDIYMNSTGATHPRATQAKFDYTGQGKE